MNLYNLLSASHYNYLRATVNGIAQWIKDILC